MATSTTFKSFYLGKLDLIDPTEGNNIAENASALVGGTYGGAGDPLYDRIETLRDWDISGPNSGDNQIYKNDKNLHTDTFRNETTGKVQNFDASAQYNATITYMDGTTQTFTATIFQDEDGETYLVPPATAGADLDALEAKAIRSITFDSLADNDSYGTPKGRQSAEYPVCFVAGTKIATPLGERCIEDLQVGDQVFTIGNGVQTIRWIQGRTSQASGKFAPVRIKANALAKGLPTRDLWVSQQHRMVLSSHAINRVTGQQEVMIPAKELVCFPGVEIVASASDVTYFHFLLDQHDAVLAEGVPAETLHLGPMAKNVLSMTQLTSLRALLGADFDNMRPLACEVIKGRAKREVLRRHLKNGQALLQTFGAPQVGLVMKTALVSRDVLSADCALDQVVNTAFTAA